VIGGARSGDTHAFDEARDAVQEAAFKAWRRFAQLRDGRLVRAWFLRIVTNQCLSVRRGRWWSVVRQAEVEPASGQSEDTAAERTDLERGLAQLPRDDRLALFLYFPQRYAPAW
jgi:RNA polymerase sigma-70 factor (ECF subfamily)